jgi:hypothetical protein
MRHRTSSIFVVATALMLSLASTVAHARQVTMLFWYPGEAGTTAEAQPVLDAFFEYLNTKIAPDRIAGKYFNSLNSGVAFLSKSKPTLGIVSFAAFEQNKAKMGTATELLATLPLPGGQTTERYLLVGRGANLTADQKVLSSEPLSNAFVKARLFPQIPDGVKLEQHAQLLMALRKIGEGSLDAVAILTPSEATSLARLSAPWANALQTIATSPPVPTARVLLFDPSWKESAKLREVLLSMGKDPTAQALLEEMRLKGFAPSS